MTCSKTIALMIVALVLAANSLAPSAHAEPEDIFPFVVTENNLIRGEAEGVFGYTNVGSDLPVFAFEEGQFNFFLTPGKTTFPGQPTFFESGTHERVFVLPLSASSTGVITWVMVEGANEATTDNPATSNSVVRPFEGVDTYTHAADSPALPTDRVVVRDGGKFNVTADLTVETLSLIDGGVANLLDGELTVGSSMIMATGGTFNSQVNLSTDTLSVQDGGMINLLDGELTIDTVLGVSAGGEFRAVGGTLSTNLALIDAGGRLVASGGEHDFGFGLDNFGETVLVDTTIDGAVINKAGSTATIVGDVIFNGVVSGPGEFFGPGTATFNGGLAPGSSPAEVGMEGSIAFGDANTLQIELGGVLAGEFDALLVEGDADLGGNLDVALLGGFTLAPEQVFNIVEIGGVQSGEFASLGEGATVGSSNVLYISYAGGDGNDVILYTDSFEADFDFDGDVDGDDFLAWQGGFGLSSGATFADGDADADGDVDGDDFLAWQAQFGSGSGANSGASAVPEPASVLLALLAVAAAFGAARKHRARC